MKVIEHPERRSMQIGRWLGVVVSLVLLLWVLRSFDLAEVGRALLVFEYSYLLPVLTILVLNYALRAFRWGTLFSNRLAPAWRQLFVAMMIGYLVNNLLPARAGELVRVYVIGERSGVAKSEALGTVAVERVADVLMALLLLAGMLILYPMPTWLGRTSVVISAFALASLTFLTALNIRGPRLLIWSLRWLHFLPEGWLKKIETVGNGFIEGISGLRNPRLAMIFLLYTMMIWFLEGLSVWLIGQAFILPISISGSLFLILVVGLGTMIPSAPGYLGTYEFFGVSALAALNISGSKALAFALMLHVISFAGTNILGATCLALSGQNLLQRRKANAGLLAANPGQSTVEDPD